MSEIQPLTNQIAIVAAGTPQQMRPTEQTTHNKMVSITITALLTNTGNIYITRSDERGAITTSGAVLAPGDTWELDVTMFTDAFFKLSELWLDGDNTGEGVCYTAVEAVDVP